MYFTGARKILKTHPLKTIVHTKYRENVALKNNKKLRINFEEIILLCKDGESK